MCAIVIGLEWIVLKLYAAWTVALTGFVNQDDAGAIMDGQAACVINLRVTVDVQNMANAKMEPACVHKDGTVGTARCRAVKMDAPVMDNVHWKTVNTDVSALKVGLVQIARLH